MSPLKDLKGQSSHSRDNSHTSHISHASSSPNPEHVTVAPFSPSSSHSPLETRPQRSSVLIQQKSPLLIATPPQITRALAYSYPFVRPLNKFVGLLSWTNDDPWESFLLVATFWAVTLYGGLVIRWAGPISVVIFLMLAMYARRFSSLSSNEWTGEKKKALHKRTDSQLGSHQSLEDVVENLRLFTSRCNILLDPMLRLTDFLSTQTSATSATTRPALMAMFWRIALITPVWITLTLSPLRVITTRRVVMAVGTTILTWHSQPARVTRTIFWRSKTFRRICSVLTGLNLMDFLDPAKRSSMRSKTAHDIAASLAVKGGRNDPGIRFTFTIYENERRWLGIGWTHSLLAYERSAWTDEHLNSTPSAVKFELPEVTGGISKWQWVEGTEWHVVDSEGKTVPESSDAGWVFYDNKWQHGRSGKDGWGRYTRRRKWCRDAELIELSDNEGLSATPNGKQRSDVMSTTSTLIDRNFENVNDAASTQMSKDDDSSLSSSFKKRKPWFGRRSSNPSSEKSTALSASSARSTFEEEEDYHVPLQQKEADRSRIWGMGDDAEMSFG
jgi:hypothetical protein